MAKKEPLVEMKWPVDRMRPHPDNPRTHPDDQVSGLASSFDEFGVLQFPVIDESGLILAGHGRWMAAQKQGRIDLPVIVVTGWSEEKKLAFMVADNRWAMLGGFDQVKLRAAVYELQKLNYDLAPVGFTLAQATELLSVGNVGNVDPEETPPVQKRPIVRTGDLWTLGHHRILCGDSTRKEDVAKLLGQDRPLLMVTDPPYGVEYDADWRNEAAKKGLIGYGASAIAKVVNDDRVDWSAAWELFTGDVAYVWHASLKGLEVDLSLRKVGLFPIYQIVWRKPRFVISRGDYHWSHECAYYAVRKGKNHHWCGNRSETTVWDIPHQKSETGHSTQKPVECMAKPIRNNSRPGEYIYDPFVGSGTTIIACEMTGRICLAVEINPIFAEMTIDRWQRFTGKIATLDGVAFEEVAAARRKGKPTKKKRPQNVRALSQDQIET